jgi:hypothetical protein
MEVLMRTTLPGACLLMAVVAAGPGSGESQAASQLRPVIMAQADRQASEAAISAAARSQLSPPATDTAQQQVAVGAVVDKDFTGASGTDLGEIERVVEGRSDQKTYLVISRGGFLGLFDEEFLVPVERVAMRRGRVVAPELTEAQLRELPMYGVRGREYRELGDGQTISITEQK